MHLPPIDAIQLLIRNWNIIDRKGSARLLPASDHVIHAPPPLRLTLNIGAPLAGLFSGCISTPQIAIYAPLSLHIGKITAQKLAAADRGKRHNINRFPAGSRKPSYEQDTCAQHQDEDTHSIGTRLGAKSHSDFACLAESTARGNFAHPELRMLDIAT